MTAILGLLIIALLIALIVGLVKPALVIRWTNKPTRLKVFGYWFLATFAVGIIGVATESDEERAKSSVEDAKNYIKEENYSSAISTLENVDKDNPLYPEVQQLLQEADSMSKIIEEKDTQKEIENKQSNFTKKEISTLTISSIMNQPTSIITSKEENGTYFVSYKRPSDGKHFEYKIKFEEANKVIWGNSDGRWRDTRHDEQITYSIKGDTLVITQKFSEGSSSDKQFVK